MGDRRLRPSLSTLGDSRTILGGPEDGWPVAERYIGAVSGPEAKNLEAISRAIDQHNANCPFPASEVRMNPFEIERLGWDEIRGLPIVPDPSLGTGRFRIVCSRDSEGGELEEIEAVGTPVEVGDPTARARLSSLARDRGRGRWSASAPPR